jgi:hypothetical protein
MRDVRTQQAHNSANLPLLSALCSCLYMRMGAKHALPSTPSPLLNRYKKLISPPCVGTRASLFPSQASLIHPCRDGCNGTHLLSVPALLLADRGAHAHRRRTLGRGLQDQGHLRRLERLRALDPLSYCSGECLSGFWVSWEGGLGLVWPVMLSAIPTIWDRNGALARWHFWPDGICSSISGMLSSIQADLWHPGTRSCKSWSKVGFTSQARPSLPEAAEGRLSPLPAQSGWTQPAHSLS